MAPRHSKVERNSLRDKDYAGEDYQAHQDLLNGPLHDRRCSDCFFALIFLAFIGFLGYVCATSKEQG